MTTTTSTASLDTATISSPFGPLLIAASPLGVRAILWPGDDPSRAGLAGVELRRSPNAVIDETAGQLREYFGGIRTAFELPLDLHGTAFQRAAWQALSEIPYGQTRTYGEQATRLGRPSAARAVGAANGRNPVSIVVPCHRVVGSDGALRGFAGGLPAKASLLAFERTNRKGRGSGLLPSAGPVALGGEIAVP